MSEDPRRICVCGRQRSKEPVIITITTCKNNHGTTTEGTTVRVTSVSPQTEVCDNQPEAEKTTNQPSNPSSSPSENTQSTPEVEANTDAITEDTEIPADSNQIETVEEVKSVEEEEAANDADAVIEAEEDPATEPTESVAIEEEGNTEEVEESMEQENAEVQIEDEDIEPDIATDVEPAVEENDEDIPDESEAEGDDTNPTVMMLTETAVNTVPFLNRLFWSSDIPSTKPTTNPQETNKCTLELIVLERHTGECRHTLTNLNSEKCIFDGESIIRNCGRIDIPNDTTFSETRIKKLDKTSKISHNQNPGRYKTILEVLKTYFKNKQIYDNLSTKSTPFIQLQKYLTPPSDNECAAVIPTTKDHSLQVGSTHIIKKVSRWYDGFLMCIGLKTEDSLYNIKNSKESVELQKEDSSLMAKYLRL